MLQDFRERIQGSLAKVIIVLICIPFAFFGIESFFSKGGDTDVAEVGGSKISKSQLDEAIFLKKRQLISQMGENIDYTLIEDSKLRQPALDSLINTQVLVNEAKKLGFEVADEQIFNRIIKDPTFQIDGKFSNDRFRFIVKQAGLTEEIYMRLSKNELLIQQLYSGFVAGEFLTKKDIDLYASLSNESRDVAYARLSLDKAKKEVTLTDQEMEKYYEANKNAFKTNETVVLDYIGIDKSDFIEPVTDKEIKQVYESEIAKYVPNDSYKLSHIQITIDKPQDEEKARKTIEMIRGKLAKGESFSELAKTYSDDLGTKSKGGSLGVGTADAFPKEFVAAVKSLKKGEVTQAIKLNGGLHLVKLVDLTKDTPPSFAKSKQALKAEIESAKAEPAFRNAEETLKDLAFNSQDLTEPAKEMKTAIKTTQPMTREEVAKLFPNPQLVQAIFSDEVLLDRHNTDVYETANDRFVSVHVKKYNEPQVLPFDAAKNNIKALMTAQKAEALLTAQAEALSKEIAAGSQTPEQLAQKEGYVYKKIESVKRNDFSILDRNALEAAFKLPQTNAADEVAMTTVTLVGGDKAVLMVNNVKPGSRSDLKDSEKRSLELILGQSKGNGLFGAFEKYLKAHTKIKQL